MSETIIKSEIQAKVNQLIEKGASPAYVVRQLLSVACATDNDAFFEEFKNWEWGA